MLRALLSTTPSNTPQVDIYFEHGQSLTRGNTDGVEPPEIYKNPNPNALIVGVDVAPNGASENRTEDLEVMDFDSGNFMGITHGAEPSIAYNYGTRQVIIVKVVRGGSNILTQWNDGSYLRNQCIYFINKVKTYLEDNNIQARWFSYFNQGEANVSTASQWLNAYKDLHDAIIAGTGVTWNHVFVAQLPINSTFYTGNPTNGNVLRAAQAEAASFYNGTVVNIDGATMHDGVHPISQQYLNIGNFLYERSNGNDSYTMVIS